VYSFAMIVFAYLGATFLGSLWYRRDLRNGCLRTTAQLISLLTVAAFLPILANDPWLFHKWLYLAGITNGFVRCILVLASICPLCAILGYLTPGLIDEYAAGQPAVAGKAYAVNVLGCILGPLFVSYVLLPWLNERYTIVLLSLPFFVFFSFARSS
jgi:spermidine synthase